MDISEENYKKTEKSFAESGIEVSEKKMKHMSDDGPSLNHVNGMHFRTVNSFIYLESKVNLGEMKFGEE